MTTTRARHLALALTLALGLAAGPGVAAAQSPEPAASASPAPPSAAAPGPAPEAWATAVCTAHARIADAQVALATLGQAALDGDTDTMAIAAISAGLLGDQALRALESLEVTWSPGSSLAGYLNVIGFALVDVGLALAEAEPSDADALRSALGSTIMNHDGWARTGEELALLRERHGFDCLAVPVASPEPLPQPSGMAPTAAPTFRGDPELEARFPIQVAGERVQAVSRSGAELLASQDPSDPDAQAQLDDLLGFLAGEGHTIDDVSLAFAFVPTTDGYGASITAFRVRGGDAAALLDGLIPLVTIDYDDPQRETITIGGRELTRVSDGPYALDGIYEVLVPSGDTLWAVSAKDEVLAEIVAAFPG